MGEAHRQLCLSGIRRNCQGMVRVCVCIGGGGKRGRAVDPYSELPDLGPVTGTGNSSSLSVCLHCDVL